ncbi:hypothetical protein TIFTF001_005824 [Ficus carica]|uniref:Uncharacterized protein n=1 Tax=Ficus carica TaxID=3494 RepID=A0AA87ZMK0_FICCA|nr:hypothetical protein TIFTF001_005824 [Ficus carica]
MKKIYRGWKVLQSRTGLGYDPVTDKVICSDDAWQSFIKVYKECNHLRYEHLRNKDLYYNVFEKNHAAGAFGFGSITMGGDSTPSVEFDFSIDNSGTHPVLEEEIAPTNGGRKSSIISEVDHIWTIMWHYFDAHPRLQRPFCQLDDDDRRGIIDSVVNPQPPPAN